MKKYKFYRLLFILSVMFNINIYLSSNGRTTEKTLDICRLTTKRDLSKEKGFHPIFIYSNRNTALSEIPARSTIKENNLGGEFPYSQVKQDLIIAALSEANFEIENQDFNTKKKNFFFLDLASNHALKLSNTIYLEQKNWDGICIEGNSEYWYELGRYRKCTVVGAFVGGERQNDGKEVEVALRGPGGGILGKNFDNVEEKSRSEQIVKRDLVSIETILDGAACPKIIDYFSLDVEGAESLVMENFPWQKYTFRFMTIERPKDDLINLLHRNGYIEVKKLARWGETLWIHSNSVKLSQTQIEQIISSI